MRESIVVPPPTPEEEALFADFRVASFLRDFVQRFRLDARKTADESPIYVTPGQCARACGRPAAINGECFTCQTQGRLPS